MTTFYRLRSEIKIFCLILAALLGGLACQRSAVFRIENIKFEKSLGCKADHRDCVELDLSYPLLKDGPKPGREKLNTEIRNFVFQQMDDAIAKDAEAWAANFLADYQRDGKGTPPWSESRQVQAVANTPQVFSLLLGMDGYSGGAHGNSRVEYRSYDPKTGRRYGLGDWLKKGYEKPLQELGEKAFRKARGLSSGDNLNDFGFTFEDGFKLNDNYAATPQGLVFYYNPYEIASYADGPTELAIPYSELKDWLLPKGPLDSLAKK